MQILEKFQKKGNNFYMGNWIFLKISGPVDLDVLITFTLCQNFLWPFLSRLRRIVAKARHRYYFPAAAAATAAAA